MMTNLMGRSQTANQLLNWFVVALGLVALVAIREASAWHAFDAFDASRTPTFNDYFNAGQQVPPPLQPFQVMSHNFYTTPAQFYTANQQQLLTPATSQSSSSSSSSISSSSSSSSSSLPVAEPSQPQALPLEAPQESREQPTGDQQQHQQQQGSEIVARDLSPRPTKAPVVQSVNAPLPVATSTTTPPSRPNEQLESRKSGGPTPVVKATEEATITQPQSPSPFGKILDAVASNLSTTSTTSTKPIQSATTATTTTKQKVEGAPQSQVLKARKSGDKSPTASEQQIIDQHARAAAGYSHASQYSASSAVSSLASPPQQRLLLPTTKQRDKSLGSMLIQTLGAVVSKSSAASSSSSSSAADHNSNLSQLLDNFKSGISSRSSIMKAAISDNKLARTLTSVSKSIGGNKYVAGAGVAAALAALGLTVGKFLTPYVMSSSGSQYSKFATEPLMTSGSFLMPTATSGLYNNERKFIYPGGNSPLYSMQPSQSSLDLMLASATNGLPARQQSFDFNNYAEAAATNQQPQFVPQFDQATVDKMATTWGLYPASQHSVPSSYSISNTNYLRPSTTSSSFRFTSANNNNQADKMPLDTNNGHYAKFYANNQQPEVSDSSDWPQVDQQQQQQQQQQPQQFVTYTVQPQQPAQQYGSYISGAPVSQGGNRVEYGDSSASSPSYGSGNQMLESTLTEQQPQQQQQQQQVQQQQATDQIMSAASAENPTYQRLPGIPSKSQQNFMPLPQQQQQQQARRSGAMMLKLDESARNRLAEQLQVEVIKPYLAYKNLATTTASNIQVAQPSETQQQPLISMTSPSPAADYSPRWSNAALQINNNNNNNKPPSGKSSRSEGTQPTTTTTTMTKVSEAREEGQLQHQMDLAAASSGRFTQALPLQQQQQQQQKWINNEVAAAQQQPSYTLIRPNTIASSTGTDFTLPAATAAAAAAAIHHHDRSPSSGGWISLSTQLDNDNQRQQQQQQQQQASVVGAQQVPSTNVDGDNSPLLVGQNKRLRVSRTPTSTKPKITTAAYFSQVVNGNDDNVADDVDADDEVVAKQDKAAREQLQQLATLIDARRASMERAGQLLEPTATNNKQQSSSTTGGANSIKNKSETVDDNKSNEVTVADNTNNNNDRTAASSQDDNSMQANSSSSGSSGSSGSSSDNERQLPPEVSAANAGDSVVVELVSDGDVEGGGALLDNNHKAQQKQQHSSSLANANKSTKGGDDEDNNANNERAYRGLVAGSIGGAVVAVAN